jgi:hypothetical protein
LYFKNKIKTSIQKVLKVICEKKVCIVDESIQSLHKLSVMNNDVHMLRLSLGSRLSSTSFWSLRLNGFEPRLRLSLSSLKSL